MPEDAVSAGPGRPAGPGTETSPLRIAGSAGEPWPVEGCGCVACRTGATGTRAPTALAVGPGVLSGGVLTMPDAVRALVAGAGLAVGDVRLAALPAPSGLLRPSWSHGPPGRACGLCCGPKDQET